MLLLLVGFIIAVRF